METLFIAGTIGKEPETKRLQSGKMVTNFSLAVSKGKDKTNWYDCSLWGYRDNEEHPVAKFLSKGGRVALTGEPNNRSYVKDGEAVTVNGITIREVSLLGSAPKTEPVAQSPSGSDDLPF